MHRKHARLAAAARAGVAGIDLVEVAADQRPALLAVVNPQIRRAALGRTIHWECNEAPSSAAPEMPVCYENTTMGRPKLAQVKEVFQVRLPDDRRRALQAEAETRENTPSEVIRLHLERYAEMAWRDLPKLSDNAWCAVFEAVGAVPVDVAAVAWIGMTVARAFEETELGRKWKVDASELASVSRAWTFGQACAVADATVRFHQALAVKGTDALAAARQATTRPAALVLEAPPQRVRSSTRSTRR